MDRRDSTFGERVLWSARPKVVTVPPVYRFGAVVCAIIAAVTLGSAILVSTALHAPVGKLLLFTAWMTTMAFALHFLPRWWRSELEYLVTEQNIVLRRGKLRRYIERESISYARIHWHPTMPGIGDLELVRAVPTGALRRRLAIRLVGLAAPDQVWAIIRGVETTAPTGEGQRPLAQRLDQGERVLWSAQPESRWRRWLPSGRRKVLSVVIGLTMLATGVFTLVRGVSSVGELISAGLEPGSASFVALIATISLTVLLLVGGAGAIVYSVLVRPAQLESKTWYLITDRRVLIQRGHDELHLDRSHIVDVIDAPAERGRHDLFLVLDGPRAQAFASSGAFGEEPGQGLQPVLHMIADSDSVKRILKRASSQSDLPMAA